MYAPAGFFLAEMHKHAGAECFIDEAQPGVMKASSFQQWHSDAANLLPQ